MEPESAVVADLDEMGLGLAPGFAPTAFTAPGDRLRRTATGVEIEPAPAQRARPPCPLFGRCGGCSLQHLNDDVYATWKADRVRRALQAANLSGPVAPMHRSPLGSRRRATFAARIDGGRARFGYRARRSHNIVDVPACPALAPPLARALPALRALALDAAASLGEVRLTATLGENGVDAALAANARKPKAARLRKAKAPAPPLLASDDPQILRISLDGETVLQREVPVIDFGFGRIVPPPGAFLQATREGEAALIEIVRAATEGATSVVDLFCGVGTFAVPLSRAASVHAVEADAAALAALDRAVRPKGAKPLRTQRRDLFSHPLAPEELAGADAVVFDPPRAGAQAQAKALAKSGVPTVVAVSCEPRTLARDCALLAAGGYKITQVVPVDQFVATAHIEAVAVMRRDP